MNRERPILFSGSMVRAILVGRKTVTRRVVDMSFCEAACRAWITSATVDSDVASEFFGAVEFRGDWDSHPYFVRRTRLPYAPGDTLWVRETWGQADSQHDDWTYHRGKPSPGLPTVYRADNPTGGADDEYWRPSIHMPRWASRITLRVAGVRAERLRDISEEGAIAEGIDRGPDFFGCPMWRDYSSPDSEPTWCADDPRGSFETLWGLINGKRPGCSWADNPWVWVVSFEVASCDWDGR